MQTRSAYTINDAIACAKRLLEDKPFAWDTFLYICEIYRQEDGTYRIYLPETNEEYLGRIDCKQGVKLGYFDGRYRTVEQLQAERERDIAIELADDQ